MITKTGGLAFALFIGVIIAASLFDSAHGQTVGPESNKATDVRPRTENAAGVVSEGAMEGGGLQRTAARQTKGLHKLGSFAWKSEMLFNMNKPSGGRGFDGSLTIEEFTFSEPIIAEKMIYCSSYTGNGHLLALDRDTGLVKWRHESRRAWLSVPAVAGGTVYVGSWDSFFIALDGQTGQQKWKSKLKGWGFSFSSPAVYNGTVYFGSASGEVYAVDAVTGQTKWTFKTKGILTAPAIAAGTLYIGSESNYLYALDVNTGQEKWRFKADGDVWPPSVKDDAVFFRTAQGGIYAVGAQTGEQRWKVTVGKEIPRMAVIMFGLGRGVAVEGQTVYAGATDGLYALDAETGKTKWRFDKQPPVSSPVVADGAVFFGTVGKIYSLDTKDGQEKWVIDNSGNHSSAPTVLDGMLYFVNSDGHLYAVR